MHQYSFRETARIAANSGVAKNTFFVGSANKDDPPTVVMPKKPPGRWTHFLARLPSVKVFDELRSVQRARLYVQEYKVEQGNRYYTVASQNLLEGLRAEFVGEFKDEKAVDTAMVNAGIPKKVETWKVTTLTAAQINVAAAKARSLISLKNKRAVSDAVIATVLEERKPFDGIGMTEQEKLIKLTTISCMRLKEYDTAELSAAQVETAANKAREIYDRRFAGSVDREKALRILDSQYAIHDEPDKSAA